MNEEMEAKLIKEIKESVMKAELETYDEAEATTKDTKELRKAKEDKSESEELKGTTRVEEAAKKTDRMVLLALCIKYKGDWEEIKKALTDKKELPADEIKAAEELYDKWCVKGGDKIITIIDEEYPKYLISSPVRPPFVLFCRGNTELLKKEGETYRTYFGIVGSQDLESGDGKDIERVVKITQDTIDEFKGNAVIMAFSMNGTGDTALRTCLLKNYSNVIEIICTGLNNAYPAENGHVQEAISKNGLVITTVPWEIEPGSAPSVSAVERSDELMTAMTDFLISPVVKRATGTEQILRLKYKLFDYGSSSKPRVYITPKDILDDVSSEEWTEEDKKKGRKKKPAINNSLLAEGVGAPFLGKRTITHLYEVIHELPF